MRKTWIYTPKHQLLSFSFHRSMFVSEHSASLWRRWAIENVARFPVHNMCSKSMVTTRQSIRKAELPLTRYLDRASRSNMVLYKPHLVDNASLLRPLCSPRLAGPAMTWRHHRLLPHPSLPLLPRLLILPFNMDTRHVFLPPIRYIVILLQLLVTTPIHHVCISSSKTSKLSRAQVYEQRSFSRAMGKQ